MYPINPQHRDLVDLIVAQHQEQIRADARTARQQGPIRIHPAAAIVIIVVAVFIISVSSAVAASAGQLPERPGIPCPFVDTVANAQQRCLFHAVWRMDTDDDGLSNGVEIFILHTDPRDRDTDNDGLSDYNEVVHFGTDPRMQDTDGDGVDDFLEFAVDPPVRGIRYA